MPKRLVAVLLFACSFAAAAQTLNPAAQQVQLLAPQLVPFAGSAANFESLVLGLTQGLPVTLTSTGANGLLQIATFQPAGGLTALDAARTLEATRQSLISSGIANPTAQQLATVLAGTSVPVQVRNEVVQATTPSVIPGVTVPSAVSLQNAAAPFLPPGLSALEATQTVQLAAILLAQQGIFSPTPEQLRAALLGGTVVNAAGSAVTLRGVLQGNVRQANAAPAPGNLSNSPFFGTSDSPVFNAAGAAPGAVGPVTVTPPANLNAASPALIPGAGSVGARGAGSALGTAPAAR